MNLVFVAPAKNINIAVELYNWEIIIIKKITIKNATKK